jgi:hypothetical protein
MKNALKLLLLTALVSCEPQDHIIENMDIILIDKDTPDSYVYADLSQPNQGWIDMPNEKGGLYTFTLDGDTVTVYSSRVMKIVSFTKSTMDRNTKALEINDNSFIGEIHEYGAFTITY